MLMITTARIKPTKYAPIPLHAPRRKARTVESLISAPPRVLCGGINAKAICGTNTNRAPNVIEVIPCVEMLARASANTVIHTKSSTVWVVRSDMEAYRRIKNKNSP